MTGIKADRDDPASENGAVHALFACEEHAASFGIGLAVLLWSNMNETTVEGCFFICFSEILHL